MMKRRLLFNMLWDHLQKKQITLLLGARQTGKTTLLKQMEKELTRQNAPTAFITLEDKSILKSLNQRPTNLFQFIPPLVPNLRQTIFIDEVQYLDDPSNFLKHLYDEYQEKIKFIVTGSSGFYVDQKFKDSLAGRKRIFHLPTIGFREFLIFKDREDIVEYAHTDFLPKLYLSDLQTLLSEYLVYGGFPDVVLEPLPENKKSILKELANSYVKKDALEASIHYPEVYLKIMKILAFQIGGLLNLNTISKALKIKYRTVESYLQLMQKSFHISLVNPFYRSAVTELRKMKKAYFNDLGLRNYFINNFTPILLRDDRGILLENYVFRLLNDMLDLDDIRYWRTQKKQEVDFIIQENHAVEVKFAESSFNLIKYNFFKHKYQNIPLLLIHFENVLEINFAKLFPK